MILARPQLRPYQVDGVQRLRLGFRAHRRVLCVLPTGGGKTVVASWIIDSAVEHGSRVLFLAHRTELIEQASRKLDEFGVDHGVIKSAHGRQDLSKPVQVASVQTLVRRLDRLAAAVRCDDLPWAKPFDLIVVDEAHHTSAGSYLKILEAYPEARILGLTATPYRMDGDGLGDCYDHLEALATVPQLIEAGYLVRTRTFAPAPPEALGKVHTRAGEFRVDEAAEVLDQVAPLQEIVDTWHRHAADRLTVAFGCTVQHGQKIATAFRACGIAAAAIDGNTPAGERADVLSRLAAGELRVVANCGILTEGWDLPACSSVILARPTKSRSLWRQMVGRGMRSAPGKTDCLILDHAANCSRFGTPDEADAYSLLGAVPEEHDLGQQILCPNCSALNDASEFLCVECRAHLPRPKSEEKDERGWSTPTGPRGFEERKALELGEVRPLTEEERKAWYHARLEEADARGYKSGWAAHRYRERFAQWPPSHWAHGPRIREVHV